MADKAAKDLRDNLITTFQCQNICDKANRFREIYQKAQDNHSEPCKDMWYIETADETHHGCRALYRFDNGIKSYDIPCKVGEEIELKYDPMKGQFSPIKITVNNG